MTIVRIGNSYCGCLEIGCRKYTYVICMENFFENNMGSLYIDWRLKLFLGPTLNNFLSSNNFKDPNEFHSCFHSFLIKKMEPKMKCETWLQNPLKVCTLIKNLTSDIKNVKKLITDICLESGTIKIEVQDSQLRNHKAVLKLSSNYPRENIEIISCDLPVQKTSIENIFNFNIFLVSEFCKEFLHLINTFQEFWDIMSLIDSQCCVLDPVNPSFKDTSRRVKVTETLSVMLTFNPFVPRERPNIQFLGCQLDVNNYKSILQKNLEKELWDSDEDVIYNLSNLLEANLSKVCGFITAEITESALKSTEVGECAICFTWRLNDEIPNEICQKETCKSMYHSLCLFKYLSSLSRNKDFFGKIQGECPNCDEFISCVVPSLNKIV